MDFSQLSLSCSCWEDDEKWTRSIDILCNDWEDTKEFFQEPTNEEFCLKIRLQIRGVHDEAFEVSDTLPPWEKEGGDPTDTSDQNE
ncbi:hypothetical protein N7493_005164 [Penicillium malachiteum]|uniref:Uncharacterized protein n=1 Tax=Penicillium malachiteum TaxID=1324776 RepID=A0AAD6HM42_9EURO|nr:hypothetical protein N7493_005164 [Penicillium malachiteum]